MTPGPGCSGSLIPAKPPLPTIPGTSIVNANAILPFLVQTQTGNLLSGLLAAGILVFLLTYFIPRFSTMFSDTNFIFVFFILTVAAAEAAIGLAILVVLFRSRQTINVADLDTLKG